MKDQDGVLSARPENWEAVGGATLEGGSEVTSEYMVFVLLFYNAALFTLVNYEDMEVDSSQLSQDFKNLTRELYVS